LHELPDGPIPRRLERDRLQRLCCRVSVGLFLFSLFACVCKRFARFCDPRL
jgi:hypothetical protein